LFKNSSTGIAVSTYLFNFSVVQLLTSDDHGELNIIQNSIMTLFRKDPPGAIMGLFSQVPVP
jgi:hypothetical protein